MEPVQLTREELYEAVWTEPARTLAKRYGVSDVALGKACRRLRIPRPWPGYWRQRECGKHVRRPRLPKLKPDEQEKLASVTFGPRNPSVKETPEEPTGPVAERKRYEANHPITVPGGVSCGWAAAHGGGRHVAGWTPLGQSLNGPVSGTSTPGVISTLQ